MFQALKGKPVAAAIYDSIRERSQALTTPPKLSVILVGEDPASQTYVGAKAKKCEALGFLSETIRMPTDTTQEALREKIERLNRDKTVNGILVQLPLPSPLSKFEVFSTIDPKKDVDGVTPHNVGLLSQARAELTACTPTGIMRLLEHYGVEIAGKEAVVIGRSDIVGKPMATLLQQQNATVTVCHSRTRDLQSHCQRAELLVVAMGKPQAVSASWIRAGATVVDVGIHRKEGKLVGDVDYESVSKVASGCTPVPGGVGPLTIALLMENVLKAALWQGAK